MFLPPLRRQFSREGVVQQGGFAGFVGVEDGLDFFLGGIEFRKEGFDARDEAVLLGKRGKRENYFLQVSLSDCRNCCRISIFVQVNSSRPIIYIMIIKQIFIRLKCHHIVIDTAYLFC